MKAALVPIERFPEDFMLRLSPEEFTNLRCHSGTSSEYRHHAGLLAVVPPTSKIGCLSEGK
jgi:hypothetical protein